jgi:hypothetical protein
MIAMSTTATGLSVQRCLLGAAVVVSKPSTAIVTNNFGANYSAQLDQEKAAAHTAVSAQGLSFVFAAFQKSDRRRSRVAHACNLIEGAVAAFPDTMQHYAAVRDDCLAMESGARGMNFPLWRGNKIPSWIPQFHNGLRARGGAWVFWADWYEGYLIGQPLDVELLEAVALIPNEAWEKGDAHVNAIIAHIYDQFRGSGSSLGQPRLSLPLVARQAAVLRDYVLAELERIRGHNEWSASDLPRVERVKELLEEALSAVNAILESLDDPNTSTEDALVVVEQKLPAVVDAAENLSSETASPKISEPMLAIAATVKVLTDAGLDPKDAGRLAAADVLGPKLLVWFKSFWRKKA